MAHRLTEQAYGKSRVRVSRITRSASQHDFIELALDISLGGDFDVAYTEGNNLPVIPTDTMKNTLYALAKLHGIPSCESFARRLAQHFLDKFPHVRTVEVSAAERIWIRHSHRDGPHPHTFVGGGSELRTCHVSANRADTMLHSGIDGLQVLKTTGSGFSGFLRDEYTTLAEVDDRIFATTITASWPCQNLSDHWTAHRQTIRAAMLAVFADRYSHSVQETLYEMATAAFAACPAIDEITLSMPNQHHLLASLEPLGLENPQEVFVPTSEPFGMISATIQRDRDST